MHDDDVANTLEIRRILQALQAGEMTEAEATSALQALVPAARTDEEQDIESHEVGSSVFLDSDEESFC